MTLEEFFRENPSAAIAFSGGADSVFLLNEALRCGARVRAYYVRSAFQPQFELDDARRAAKLLSAGMTVIDIGLLSRREIAANTADRCYLCKKTMLSAIAERAADDGFTLLADGTNASDRADGRPGMRALAELSVRSPLRECGLTKDTIRRLSREAGLFTWNKPAYACLATRIPEGTEITEEKLRRTEMAEDFMASLGFSDFRVRTLGDAALIQVRTSQLGLMMENRARAAEELGKYYKSVFLDTEVRSE